MLWCAVRACSTRWWAVQEAPFPELKAQRKDGFMAKTLVWAVEDLGSVLVLRQRVLCAKKVEWGEQASSLLSFVLAWGAECF